MRPARFRVSGLCPSPTTTYIVDVSSGSPNATWRQDDGDLCTTGTVAMESAAARDRLAAALRARPGGRTVRIEGRSRVGYELWEE